MSLDPHSSRVSLGPYIVVAACLVLGVLLTVIGETDAAGAANRSIADLPLDRMQVADELLQHPQDRPSPAGKAGEELARRRQRRPDAQPPGRAAQRVGPEEEGEPVGCVVNLKRRFQFSQQHDGDGRDDVRRPPVSKRRGHRTMPCTPRLKPPRSVYWRSRRGR